MAVESTGRRRPVSAASSSCGLSLLLHGLLAFVVVYGPQWLHGKPFQVPLNYEVTLISPKETGNAGKGEVSLPAGRTAPAMAKAALPPRERLTLPSPQRSAIRNDELALPSRRRAPERQADAPAVVPQAPPRIVAPQVSSVPSVSQPMITAPGAALMREGGGGQGLGAATETGVTIGNTDPALAYYFVLIQDKITSNWIPPKMSPGTTANVSVSLKILRSGQVRGLTVGSSSGDRLLDNSAVRAVSLSSPLPPLPPLYKAEMLSLDLRFTFVGEKS